MYTQLCTLKEIYKLNLWTQFDFNKVFFTNHLKFYILLCTSMNRSFICFIWVRYEEENAFQNLDVRTFLKWNMLITKFYRFYHNKKVWRIGKDLVSTCGHKGQGFNSHSLHT
jgi:hypothetical protein